MWHWSESTQYDRNSGQGGLFAEYVNCFLRLKQESSGWPQGCNSPEERAAYIQEYERMEGVRLNPDNIPDKGQNSGLRSLSKLMLNSFWGRFGMRLDKPETMFLRDNEAHKLFQMYNDRSIELENFHIVNDSALHLTFRKKNGFIPDNVNTNIFIAIQTTAHARLKLYSELERVGRRALYCDTDSIIYSLKDGEADIPLGRYLGEMTDELDGHHIEEFISGGCKQYSYRLSNGTEHCKVRGFTLNHRNSELVNLESIKKLLFGNWEEGNIVTKEASKINRDKGDIKLYNAPQQKVYRIVFDKRCLLDNMDTLPFGY